MKKLLSLFLALILTCSVFATQGPSLQARADDLYRVYAYKTDGSYVVYTKTQASVGLILKYDNNMFITRNGFSYRFLEVKLQKLFSDNYTSVYIEANVPEYVELYIDGEITLSASKMTHGGNTFYAALGSNKPIDIFPGRENNKLYVSGSYKGDKLDAPLILINTPGNITATSDFKNKIRLNIQTYIDMRYCKDAGGLTVSPTAKKLSLDSCTFRTVTRSAIPVVGDTEVTLKGSVIFDLSFHGTEGPEGSNGSLPFAKLIHAGDFCGVCYDYSYYCYGSPQVWFTEDYISGYTSAQRHFHSGTRDPESLGKLPLPDTTVKLTYTDVAAAFDKSVDYKLGSKLPETVNAKGLTMKLAWEDENGNDCTGKEVQANTSYKATARVCPIPSGDTPPVYYIFDEKSYAPKPESALLGMLIIEDANHIPQYVALYPGIDPKNAPVITQQPTDQTYYVGATSPVIYTVKAENAVSYQWHAVRTDNIDLTLTDDAVYNGVKTNTLRVKNPADADMVKEFYCIVSSPLFPDVKSEHAALKRTYRISSVDVLGLDNPKAGPYSGRDTAFTVAFDPSYAVTHTKSVEYRDYESNGFPTVFTAGSKLRVTVTVELTQDGYEFQHDGAVGLWNGQMVAAVFPENGNYRLAQFTFTAVVNADANAILFADLRANNPGVGGSRSDFSFDILTSDPLFFVASVTVSPYTQMIEAKTEYTVNFTLLANGGYYFVNDTRFRVDGEIVEATLSNSNRAASLVYKFTAPSNEIEVAEIFANVPKIGEKLDPSKNTVSSTGDEKDRFAYSGAWDVERDNENKVTADYTRALNFTLTARDGFYFTPSTSFIVHYKNDDGADATLTLNNDLTANADAVDLLAIFDAYPAIHEHTPYKAYRIEGNNKQHEFSCKYCHAVFREDHIPGEWIVDQPATAAAEGKKHKECTVCGYVTQTEVIEKTDVGSVKLGDVNHDGKITSSDARLALRRAVGLETYAAGSVEFKACDVNKDNKVTAADARLILRGAVGLDDPLKW